jgi:hypothetical protein
MALTHFSRSFYVAASSPAHVRELLIENSRVDQAELLALDSIEEATLAQVPVIRADLPSPSGGVLWRSGRVFFPAS